LIYLLEANNSNNNISPKLIEKPPSDTWGKTILKNGCHSLSYLDLLSLETTFPNSDKATIKKKDPQFKVGWLHDEIINSFIRNVTEVYSKNCLYVCSTTAMSISHGNSFRRLWSNRKLCAVETILIPFNPSGSHWILVVLNKINKTITILDPLKNTLNLHQRSVKLAIKLGKSILKAKFDVDCPQFNWKKNIPCKLMVSIAVFLFATIVIR